MGISRQILAIALLAILTGCMVGGNDAPKVEQSQLTSFKEGVTTYADVVAALGPPASTQSNSDGTRTITYMRMNSNVDAVTFIPVVGLVAGSGKSEYQSTLFTFDKSGRLKSYTTQGSQACTSGGAMGAYFGGATNKC